MPHNSMVFGTAGVFPPRAVEFLRAAGTAVAGILIAAVLALTLVGLTYTPAGRFGLSHIAHLPGAYWAMPGEAPGATDRSADQ